MIRKLEPLLRESKQASLSVKDLIQSGPGAGVLSSIQRCTHGLESPPFVRWNNRENVWGRRGMGSCSSKYKLSMEDLLTEDTAYKSILPRFFPLKLKCVRKTLKSFDQLFFLSVKKKLVATNKFKLGHRIRKSWNNLGHLLLTTKKSIAIAMFVRNFCAPASPTKKFPLIIGYIDYLKSESVFFLHLFYFILQPSFPLVYFLLFHFVQISQTLLINSSARSAKFRNLGRDAC